MKDENEREFHMTLSGSVGDNEYVSLAVELGGSQQDIINALVHLMKKSKEFKNIMFMAANVYIVEGEQAEKNVSDSDTRHPLGQHGEA